MLMNEPSLEMISHWREIWKEYKDKITPDRKTGAQLVEYLKTNYPLEAVDRINGEDPSELISLEIMENDYSSWKLPAGRHPEPVAFAVKKTGKGEQLYNLQDDIFKGLTIFVAIDMVTGCFHCEGSSRLYDELVAFQGLDEMDLNNSYLVAEYVECRKKFGMDIN